MSSAGSRPNDTHYTSSFNRGPEVNIPSYLDIFAKPNE